MADEISELKNFTPQLSLAPEEIFLTNATRKKEPSESSSSENSTDDASTTNENSSLTFYDPLQSPWEFEDFQSIEKFYFNLRTKDMSSVYTRKKFWQMGKFQRIEFWCRIEYCLRLSIAVSLTAFILSYERVEKLVVDKVYIIIFIICGLGQDLTKTLFDCSLGLFGVGLAALFSSLVILCPFELNTTNAYISICILVLFVGFFLGSYVHIRLYFVVHLVYYFYVNLNGNHRLFAFRQLLEFCIASAICCLFNLLPLPVTLHREFSYKLSLAFEKSIGSLKLLLATFQQKSPGKVAILFARAERSRRIAIRTRDFLQSSIRSLWLEMLFSFETYVNHRVSVKVINNILLFISCIESLAKDQSIKGELDEEKAFNAAMNEFVKVLEEYTFDTVSCYLDEKKRIKAEKRENARRALNRIWSEFRNMRYKEIFSENKMSKLTQKGPSSQLFQDFKMFCVSSILYSVTVIDQICARKRNDKGRNLSLAFSFLKELIRKKLRKEKISKHFCSFRTYLILLQNTLAVLLCTGIAFFTKSLYPHTMSLIFPVGFCWTDRMAGTYVRNLQRLLGSVFGCFYGLLILSFFGYSKVKNILALFAVVFVTTFIKANQKYSYFAEVFAFTSCWILFSFKPDSNIDKLIFNNIKLTFLGTLISICLLMVLRPRRANKMVFHATEENLKIAHGEVVVQKGVFKKLERTFNESVSKEKVKDLIKSGYHSSSFLSIFDEGEPATLYDFLEGERNSVIGEALFHLERNYQLIHNLIVESTSEPQLFFGRTDKDALEGIIRAAHDLTNFVVVTAHSCNDNDMGSMVQIDALNIDFEEIFSTIAKSIEKIFVLMKAKKKSLEILEDDFDNVKEAINKIDKGFELYYESVKSLLLEEGNLRMRKVSFGQYRFLWGLCSLLFSIRKTFFCIFDLKKALVFSKDQTFIKT